MIDELGVLLDAYRAAIEECTGDDAREDEDDINTTRAAIVAFFDEERALPWEGHIRPPEDGGAK